MTTAAASAAASAAAQQQSRRRKVNNLTQSLGRMAHVKGKTLAWLKLYDKVRSRDSPSSVSVHTFPSVFTLRPPLPPALAPSDKIPIVLPTPTSTWAADLPPPLPFACSFCGHATAEPVVTYNFMLPSPYVLTCASCAAKK